MKLFSLIVLVISFSAMLLHPKCYAAGTNLLDNPGFEEFTTANSLPLFWSNVWDRDAGGASGELDPNVVHSGRNSVRVDSVGKNDWSLASPKQIPVHGSDLVTISAWVKSQNCSSSEIGVVERDAQNNVISWSYGSCQFSGTIDWTYLKRTLVVDDNCATIQYRLIGNGPGTVWIDDTSLTIDGSFSGAQANLTPITLRSSTLIATIDPAAGGSITFVLTSAHKNQKWSQLADRSVSVVKERKLSETSARIAFIDRGSGNIYTGTVNLDPGKPEATLSVTGDPSNSLDGEMSYPPAFATSDTESLVIPNNEGVLYPANDQSVYPYSMPLYQGHGGLCMAWYGQYEPSNGAGVMTIVNTPDDATLDLTRIASDSHLVNQLVWESSKGKFAYERKLQYIFLPQGGYVAQAGRYLEYASQMGLVKTLAQKKLANPNVDKLIGAADIWDWDSDGVVAEASAWKAAGLDKVLFANEESPEVIDRVNALGYLTGRYDIYQDEYPPSAPKWDRKSDMWPRDLMVDKNGSYVQSWVDYQTGSDGKKIGYPADAACSIPSLARVKKDVPNDLANHHYSARFIDTITASPWRECYSPDHPTTRTSDKSAKMQILGYVSGAERLVTGSETGIDCAVPYEDYFEGMESLSRYRLPDSGYKVGVYQTPTSDFLKYQIGVGYRIPLFELVYHDCMVSTWYWGDASNQEPEVWRQRDLWNVLYGTNPIYVLDARRWTSQKDRIIQSYSDVSKADRAVGYARMIDHRFITPDKTIQQTTWSNGVVITVNFGTQTYLIDGKTIQPLDYDISKRLKVGENLQKNSINLEVRNSADYLICSFHNAKSSLRHLEQSREITHQLFYAHTGSFIAVNSLY